MQSLTMTQREPPEVVSPLENIEAQTAKILQELFEQLPEEDQEFLQRGSIFLGLNASVCGLIANSSFRKILNISQARIVSTLPTIFIPLTSTYVACSSLIVQPLLTDDLNCLSCAVVRGGFIGSVVGALYPVTLALFLNGALAARYSTAPLPHLRSSLRFWITASRPVFKKMSLVLALQTMAGAYLGFRSHGIYLKMFQIPQTKNGLKD
ncbi:transmembrane protein 126A-like [Alligator sinensis]|uniref:Transmembrane protein 126A-like n=1 Tax=Alligator sinensis TaxID=38654 RepID=A0A1U7SK51_ALLSI|nr:transmembrane protein 126A-like [Alligator sinensis]